MQPLAFKLRPSTFEDIIGQDHLVGKNGIICKMLNKNQLCSMILYGPPGVGKTSIATVLCSYYPLNHYFFNASVDLKSKLKDIVDSSNYYETCLLIIDEIHRMKKDTQDFLLPFLENGKITVCGLTTENPYSSINPAIRSRCHIYRLNEIKKEDVILILKKAAMQIENLPHISDEVYNYIAVTSSMEIRTALNMLEVVSLLDEVTIETCKQVLGAKSFALDQNGEHYYDLLSAMIKSIRGSDIDAALHYLARLLKLGDLAIICRRIKISSYEDIGLANPYVGPRVLAACDAALDVGLPEARIPLAYAVCELALSPKSNSAYEAINAAIEDLETLESMSIPPHILNKELKSGKYQYLYPHDFEGGYVKQQYMPDELLGKEYYHGKETGKYERALLQRYKEIKKINQ